MLTLRNIEADSFWCMSKLLDGIQDNYTFAQPGIQRKVKALEELVSRIDETVHVHMQQYEVEYLQFAFRWMNNLLMRELPLRCTIRLWDTYQVHTHTTNTHVRTHTYCARESYDPLLMSLVKSTSISVDGGEETG
uniref:Rab-GAP TBC domain-containing protein n=1 Tax=Hucho hucho TaxID=62062 RepID=A0A4W5LCS4_9TELE